MTAHPWTMGGLHRGPVLPLLLNQLRRKLFRLFGRAEEKHARLQL
jgi:hypothetical protein